MSAARQAIPKGYKQTEVGVIPHDWEVRKVSELVRSGPKNGYSGRSGLVSNGTATLSLSATTSGSLILNSETVKYLQATIPPESDLFLRLNDVLVQRSNTIELVGTTAVFTGPENSYIYPDLMMRLRFRNRVLAQWFWRYANSSAGRSYFTSVAAGSTGSMPKLSGNKLRDMPLPLPPTLAEQEAIASALSDADGLIESLETLIAKKRQIKHGTMQELLTGQRRLPGFTGDWDTKSLLSLVTIVQGQVDPQLGPFRSMYLVGPAHIESATGKLLKLQTAAEQNAISGKYLFQRGDVVYGKINPYLRKVFMADFPGLCSADMYPLRPGKDVSSGFILAVILGSEFTRYAESVSVRSGMPKINREEIAGFSLSIPPTLAEQSAIAAILSDMDAEIAALESKLAKARQVKQGMMQELLTGRIRLR